MRRTGENAAFAPHRKRPERPERPVARLCIGNARADRFHRIGRAVRSLEVTAIRTSRTGEFIVGQIGQHHEPVTVPRIRNRKPEREGVDGSAVHRTGRNRNGGIKSRVFELAGLFAEKQQIQLLRIDRRFRCHSSRPDLLAISVSGNTELDGKVRRDRNTTARILSTPRYQYAKYAQKHGELRQRLPEKYG